MTCRKERRQLLHAGTHARTNEAQVLLAAVSILGASLGAVFNAPADAASSLDQHRPAVKGHSPAAATHDSVKERSLAVATLDWMNERSPAAATQVSGKESSPAAATQDSMKQQSPNRNPPSGTSEGQPPAK
jgi:hypothetical protein